jgi:anthranilate phosphoribosyltransferase
MMTYDEALTSFEHLFSDGMGDEAMRQFLVRLYDRGETAEEIAAAATVMREHSIKLPVPEGMEAELIDNCGTGGDKSGSFNISTTVSILLAAAGCKVAKHGNRSITSKSGSADVLEALDINLNLSPEKQVEMLQQTGFTFMFAVNHHPAMKYIMPVRKSLDHRTIFNILGPLTNPAGVKKQLIGVFDKGYIMPIAKALQLNNAQRAMVVSSADGMDEIGISTVTYAATLDTGSIKEMEINPEDYGFKLYDSKEIAGGSAIDNAAIIQGVLDNSLHGAKRDIVVLNAAAALWVDGKARDIKEGVEIANQTIDSGRAGLHIDKIAKISQQLA